MNKNAPDKTNPWLFRFAVLTACVTFLLIGLGGLVTSHGAGMSVPDWPNSYGYNMFAFPVSDWVGGIFYEHTHRLLASAVGLLTTILVLWLFGKNSRPLMRWAGFILPVIGIASEILFPNRWLDGVLYSASGLASYIASFFWPRCEWSAKWLRWLGVAAFLGVILQGVLGGLRVVLADAHLGILHAIIGQLFFVLMASIALFTSRFWIELAAGKKTFSVPRNLRTLVLAATALIFCQLVIGATMRQAHAGLSIPDFPLAYGKIWPDTSAAAIASYNEHRMDLYAANPITAFQVILQMVHRLVALAIFILVAVCAWLAWHRLGKKDSLARFALFWLALIFVQIGLGAATIWSNKAADVATLHVMFGALSLVTGALWCVIGFGRSEARAEKNSPAVFGAAPALAGNK